jgi:hypothetical protein
MRDAGCRMPITDGSAVVVTVARYQTPNGVDINKVFPARVSVYYVEKTKGFNHEVTKCEVVIFDMRNS